MTHDWNEFSNSAQDGQSLLDQLECLASVVDAKDQYTRGHCVRVAVLARMLAIACGMTDAEADRIYLAAIRN